MPEMAEELALPRVVSLVGGEDIDKLMVVSGCLSLIHMLQSSEVDRSPIGFMVQDVKLLAANFTAVSFSHIFCESNFPVHTLARFAEHFVSICFRNSIPDCSLFVMIFFDQSKYHNSVKLSGVSTMGKTSVFYLSGEKYRNRGQAFLHLGRICSSFFKMNFIGI
jgi:hypothetical protein